jgi:hypothetical protein
MSEPFPGGIVAPQDWLNGILPRAPNLNPNFVKHEILSVLRDFFERSGAWREWVGPISLHPEQVTYSVELADYKANLVAILGGYRVSDEMRLFPVPNQMIGADVNVHLNNDPYIGGPPRWFYKDPYDNAIILPPPAEEGEQVRLFVTMKPSDLCCPDWIRSRHYEAILAGVLARVYQTPGPNYKPDLGARMERKYVAARAHATREAIAGGTGMTEVATIPTSVAGSQRFTGGVRSNSGIAVSGTRW